VVVLSFSQDAVLGVKDQGFPSKSPYLPPHLRGKAHDEKSTFSMPHFFPFHFQNLTKGLLLVDFSGGNGGGYGYAPNNPNSGYSGAGSGGGAGGFGGGGGYSGGRGGYYNNGDSSRPPFRDGNRDRFQNKDYDGGQSQVIQLN